jgi:hypothetical protein
MIDTSQDAFGAALLDHLEGYDGDDHAVLLRRA